MKTLGRILLALLILALAVSPAYARRSKSSRSSKKQAEAEEKQKGADEQEAESSAKTVTLTGSIKTIEKDGSAFILNRTRVMFQDTTPVTVVSACRPTDLKEGDQVRVFGQLLSIMKTPRGDKGVMSAISMVAGSVINMIDMKPTQTALSIEREKARKQKRKMKKFAVWHNAKVASVEPFMLKINSLDRTIKGIKKLQVVTGTEGTKEDIRRRAAVIVYAIVDDDFGAETAEKSSARKRRRRKKTTAYIAERIYVLYNLDLADSLMNPRQPPVVRDRRGKNKTSRR